MSAALVQSKQNTIHEADSSSSVTASAAAFTSDTIDGSLLVCVCCADSFRLTDGAAVGMPDILAPTTAGLTWVLADSAAYVDNRDVGAYPAHEGGYGARISVYYAANAPSISSAVTTSFSATDSLAEALAAQFQLYEFSERGGVETSANNAPTVPTAGSVIPGTADLITSGTDLIFVTAFGEQSSTHASHATGYTAGLSSGDWFPFDTQYILSQAPGTVHTAFGSDYGPDENAAHNTFACVAVAFVAESGTSITLTFTNATETGDFYVN